jgi:hypothetical protein
MGAAGGAAGATATAGTTGMAGGAAGAAVAAGTAGAAGGTASGLPPADYADDSHWVCRPGLAGNKCTTELTTTELKADGTTAMSSIPPAADAPVDCFYVYPTVDLDSTPTNKEFAAINRDNILDPLLSQAAPLRSLCNLYVPLYRQASIGAYLAGASVTAEKLGIAYADVAAAFDYYLAHLDTGKPLVIAGHSQGSMLSTMLIKAKFDATPELRQRLVAVLLLGALGYYNVPDGKLVGGSFANVPLCSSAAENGCVITFNSFADGFPPSATYGALGGMATAGTNLGCTNPGAIAGGKATLHGAYIPTTAHQPSFTIGFKFPTKVDTSFAVYRDFFAGECAPAMNGLPYFKVSAAPAMGDMRTNPVPFDDPNLNPALLGLHILDYSFSLDDLMTLLKAKIAAH